MKMNGEPVFFTVHMPSWESASVKEPVLSQILRAYYEGVHRKKGKVKDIEDGVQTVTSYNLAKNKFFYEKRSGGYVLQQAAKEPYGWSITKWDFAGRVTEKARYSKEFLWLQTAYYKSGNTEEPQMFLLPEGEKIRYLEKQDDAWKKTLLELSPAEEDGGALLRNTGVKPLCSLWSSEGLLWAYDSESLDSHKEAGEKLVTGQVASKSSWKLEEALKTFHSNFPDLSSFNLVEYEEDTKEEPLTLDYAADHSLRDFAENEDAAEEIQLKLVDALSKNEAEEPEEKFAEEPQQPSAEEFQQEEEKEPAEPVTRYAVAAMGLSGVVNAPGIPEKEEAEDADDVSEEEPMLLDEKPEEDLNSLEQQEEKPASLAPEEMPGEENAEESMQEKFEKIAEAPSEKEETSEKAPQDEMEEFQEFFKDLPDKIITGRDGMLYAYYGGMKEDLRHGEGRTAMANGHTAYEGHFCQDKKDGFGVYYYKSGDLCYVGNWKDNRRQGAGVSFDPQDGTMFAGKWESNISVGMGALFDEEGDLIYVGQWKDGKRHGKGTEYRKGEVIFSGIWENGDPMIEGIGRGR